jgi:glycosyltransferase involved in cell wall biosynthesis
MATSPPVYVLTHEFHPQRGGIATFTEEIAGAAAGLGHDLEVWAPALPADGPPEKSWPFRVRRLPAVRGTHNFTCQFQLARELVRHRRRLRHATVYLPEPGPMLTLMTLQFFHAFRPRRLVLTFHGSEILRFHHRPTLRLLAGRLIRHADRISTLTHYTQRLLCARFPAAAAKTFLTPGALRAGFAADGDNFPPAPAGRKVVLTVGRLHPRKGQLLTLQALQALPPALHAGLEYWIVGSTSRPHYEYTLREAAAHTGFVVRFLGDVTDAELDGIYDQADIFALTSIDHGNSVEGFGLVYLEAAAHGLPVVAHTVGGVAEAVVDAVTGLLVSPHRPAQLTAAFARLLTDAELRRRLGRAGRDWAGRNTWTRSAELLFSPPASA